MLRRIARAALFLRSKNDESEASRLNKMIDYAANNGFVVTQTFHSEEEFLACREDFDIILCCGDSIMLPIAGIEILNIA